MTYQGDPYRTLGLMPGATVNEIRSAYRRLAKRYHPDAAGERAVPRFLAIQAAYEALIDANGDLRWGGPGRSPAGAGRAGEAPQADPSRARASRDAWRTRGRSAPPGDKGTAPGGKAAPGPAPGGRPGPDGTTSGAGDRGRPGSHTEHHHRRHRRAATPGSTTYDEAGETPLDPAWDGGTWYGATSGTYWTLNPREYADPRKHGPEYRRRAWRAAGQQGPSSQHTGAAHSPPAGPPFAADVETSPAPPWSAPDAPAPGVEAEPMGDAVRSVPGAPAPAPEPAERRRGRSLPERLVARLLGRREMDPPGP